MNQPSQNPTTDTDLRVDHYAVAPYEQLRLRLYAAVDPNKVPPERGLWRELLRLAGACGPVHHVAWILYGRMSDRGRVEGCSYGHVAADGGISGATVKRALCELKRIGVVRQRRTRAKDGRHGRNVYELNLGGGFTKGHTDPRPRVTQTQHVGHVLLGLYVPDAAADVLPAEADRPGACQQQQRTEALRGWIWHTARKHDLDVNGPDGQPLTEPGMCRLSPVDLQALADDVKLAVRDGER